MADDAYIRQAAALAVRNGRICLINSRNGKRWVIPKGLIELHQTAGECALQEAWEEAGLVGKLDAEPVGTYLYEKYGGVCHVTVFWMHVTEMVQDWPERSFRERVWVGPGGALERVDDPGLADILRLAFGKKRVPLTT